MKKVVFFDQLFMSELRVVVFFNDQSMGGREVGTDGLVLVKSVLVTRNLHVFKIKLISSRPTYILLI